MGRKIAKLFPFGLVVVLLLSGIQAGMAGGVQAQSDEGLVAEWHFDEGSGSVVKDISGNGNDGTIYGATWVDGKFGKALSFDGMDDYVEITYGSLSPIGSLSYFTTEAWIKTSDMSSIGVIYSDRIKDSGVGNYFSMRIDKGILGVEIYDLDVQNQVFRPSKVNVADGNWHHVAVAIDDNTINFFIDGVLREVKGYNHYAPNPNTLATIGNRYMTRGDKIQYFNGIIDEVRIYNKALSAEEIKAHYERKQTALSLIKSASPYSIKQEQKTTVKVTTENTGTTTIKDIEVVDTPSADFDFVSGETSAKYGIIKPGESRTFQYTLRSGDTGKFDLGQATATYADEEGNYHTVESNSPMVEVLAPLEKPEIPTGEEGEEKGMPGFEVAFAIAGLSVVAYLLRRRR